MIITPRRVEACLIALAWLLLILASEAALAQQPLNETLMASALRIDISPVQLPAIRNGGFLRAVSDRVDDPLHARVLVLASGSEKVALVIVDSCMLPTELCDQIKRLAVEQSDLAMDRILISATHTHSAPSLMSYCLGTEEDPAYVNQVVPRIAAGIAQAAAQLKPAQLGWATIDASELTNCRRWLTRADRMGVDPFGQPTVRAMMHPGYQNPDYVCEAGPIDPQLSILSVTSSSGDRPIALLANFSMHYFGAGRGFSADYFGEVAAGLEAAMRERFPGKAEPFVGIMSQGTSGDLHWMDYQQPRANLSRQQYSQRMLARILEAISQMTYREAIPIRMSERRLTIQRRLPDEARLAWAKEINDKRGSRPPASRPEVYAQQAEWIAENPAATVVLQALRLGSVGICAIPNEVYGITGLKLKAQSPFETTFNLELANGAEGYIPPPEQHDLGGYTTWPARTAGLARDAEPRIVENLLQMLEETAQSTRRPWTPPSSQYAAHLKRLSPLIASSLEALAVEQLCVPVSRSGDPPAADEAKSKRSRFQVRGPIALGLEGPQSPSMASRDTTNRCVYFAGGNLQGTLPSPIDQYTATACFWNGLPVDARATTGTLLQLSSTGHRESLLIQGTEDPQSAGCLVFRFGDQSFVSEARIATRAWHHVVLTRSSDRVQVYLDDMPQPILDVPLLAAPAIQQFALGGTGPAATRFDGKLDEFALLGRVLTRREVRGLYQATGLTPPQRPAPVSFLGPKPATREARKQYASIVLASKPRAYWRLHQANEQKVRDQVSGQIGTFEGDAGVYDPRSQRPNFRGGRFRVQVDQLGECYCVEFWCRNQLAYDRRPVTGYLFSRGKEGREGAPSDSLGIGGTHSSQGRLFLYNGNERAELAPGTSLLRLNGWTHIVVNRNGNEVQVYLNGRQEPEIDSVISSTYPRDSGEMFFGGRNDNFANFQGMLEEIAVYDRLLEADEVLRHFQAGQTSVRTAVEQETSPASPSDTMDAADQSFSAPLSPDESLSRIHVPDAFRVELIAAEPLVRDPVAIDWSADGKLWVVEMADYPLGLDGQGKPGGRVRVLEDRDQDGKYDHATLFAEGLSFPTGILTWKQGVLVTAAPEILYLEDSDGDGKADIRQTLFSGFLEGNQQLRVNGLRWGLDGWVYCASGSHHAGYGKESQILSHLTQQPHRVGSRDFRFRPATGELQTQSGPSQFGRNRDDWGNWFGVQNSYPLWHYVLDDQDIRRNPHFAPSSPRHLVIATANPKVYPASRQQKRFHSFEQSGRFTSACSAMIYRDQWLFPRTAEQHAFTCEPFHNLVQHNILVEEGVSFGARRDEREIPYDFFASQDRWCRPVMIRTGPDGALWVVDMYRYMIEHPQWLPQHGKDELRPHYRAGEAYGRIYRVVPRERSPRPVVPRVPAQPAAWIQRLADSNGWIRDHAHRHLVDWLLTQAPNQREPWLTALRNWVADSQQPLAQLHALWALSALDSLDRESLVTALTTTDHRVRGQAVRLAMGRELPAPVLRTLARDPSDKVRLQTAIMLGHSTAAVAAELLGHLAWHDAQDPFLAAAILSSLNSDNLTAVTQAYLDQAGHAGAGNSVSLPNHPLFDAMLGQVAAWGTAPDHERLALRICELTADREGPVDWSLLDRCLGEFERHSIRWRDFSPQVSRRVASVLAQARAESADAEGEPERRAAAVAALLRDPPFRDRELELLADALQPRNAAIVQAASVRCLVKLNRPEIGDVLLSHWKSYSPQLRKLVLEALAQREAWRLHLLDSLEQRRVDSAQIPLALRDQLVQASPPARRPRWQAALALDSQPSNDIPWEPYQLALNTPANATRGKQVFAKHCATCHRLDDHGFAVGPDLAALTNKRPAALLQSILRPNSAVEPQYVTYVCLTRDGRVVSGLMGSETASGFELRQADGQVRRILRRDIERLEATGKSLMPEGLEKEISPEDMANLVRYLQTAGTQPDR